MKKIKLSKEMFGENAILIEAILNGLIAQNRRKENDNRKKKKWWGDNNIRYYWQSIDNKNISWIYRKGK